MNIFYFYLFLLVHPYLAMWWKSFEQADRKAWEALVPGYNYFIAFKLGSQKPWWSLLLIFPGVHIAMWSVANVSYIRRFGYFSLIDTLQGIFFPYVIMYKIATSGDKILPETNWANSKEISDREWGDHLALFLSLPILGHLIALGFAAVTRAKPGKKTKVKEWGDSIWFALIAALIIRTYVFEPFKIPTGSMEKTLLVGDFLFVNKLAYGPKVPVTPFSYPLVHNTVPFVDVKSYLGIETSNYVRLPGFGKVEQYDVVVFNYPAGDTAVYDPRMPDGLMGHNYYQLLNDEAQFLWEHSNPQTQLSPAEMKDIENDIKAEFKDISDDDLEKLISLRVNEKIYAPYINNINKWKESARTILRSGLIHKQTSVDEPYTKHYGLIYRPVDKRENYIKRCMGIPGQKLRLENSQLWVDGEKAKIADQQNLLYLADSMYKFNIKSDEEMLSKFDFDVFTQYSVIQSGPRRGEKIGVHVNKATLAKLKKENPDIKFTLQRKLPSENISIDNLGAFPNDPNIQNTVTDFQEFQIPYKGQTVKLSKDNIPYFRRIITSYEGHTLVEKPDGSFIIDGKKATTYTFGMNYYWMMGDNRFNSADSRMWGFVPEDHIVGKASMVWLSSDPNGGFRWDRMFTVIK
ncbi:MAG: signal peptidase I [Crocinitomicaceae bacterium]|nr:signal peptidase I [Crocinitomicaceae bacterium]|tara:strand:+ start:7911 stop:9803 length:1893 start_codon:yes stop_codon:yes gene_type:complete